MRPAGGLRAAVLSVAASVAIGVAGSGCGTRSAVPGDGPIAISNAADAGALGGSLATLARPPSAVLPVPKRPPPKVRLAVRSTPSKASVTWGKKALGLTPLMIERPQDSGPVDLVVRANGYFPVHVRAYSFRNDVLAVKLTRLSERMTLFGAKKELAPVEGIDPLAPPPPSPPAAPPSTSPPPG
ncbi:MAG: PEGA domain-containing protein [Myxococcales bacterium]|nr:PEGA domain-containing protein [Myxococcales bacterium]